MKLVALFWFYKDPEICVNRLKILRFFNPDLRVFGLYGGPVRNADHYKKILAPYLDDFYPFPDDANEEWKWKNGDLMITNWFRHRGYKFSWDTLIIIQADLLILKNISRMLCDLAKDEMILSGVRRTSEVQNWWPWLQKPLSTFNEFHEYLVSTYQYSSEPLCCLFIVAAIPKTFLEKYVLIKNPESGFLEYRLPMYAQVFNTKISSPEMFKCWWMKEPGSYKVAKFRRRLSAGKSPISLKNILFNLFIGHNVFHPFNREFPLFFLPLMKK